MNDFNFQDLSHFLLSKILKENVFRLLLNLSKGQATDSDCRFCKFQSSILCFFNFQ